jgi:hypothetical protein
MASYYDGASFGEKGRKFIDMVSEIPSIADVSELATLIMHRLLGHRGLLHDAVKRFKPQEFVLAIPELINGHYMHDLIKDGRKFAGPLSKNEIRHGVPLSHFGEALALSSRVEGDLREEGSRVRDNKSTSRCR